MGAFFICKANIAHKAKPALDMFADMGFASPTSFMFDDWLIYSYSKMVTNNPSFISDNDCTVITVGTPIYKGLNHVDSLAALLQDHRLGCVQYEQLIGQYTILFCFDNSIEIICDPLGCKHLFTDTKHLFFSSHMLPICQCIDKGLHINKKALYEKFLTGIIMSPNTMFEEIIQINSYTAKCINKEDTGIRFIETTRICSNNGRPRSFVECIAEQAKALNEYFILLAKSGKGGIDIGLSGGYDSRLGLACLHQYFKGPIHLHSHETENVHQKDLIIAKQMANYIGSTCHTIPTKKLCNSEHVDETLKKSILYFDGRSSFSIGGCGEVYTASYRKESTERTPFTLTGVGGELYRNIFDIGFNSIHFEHFVEDKIFSQSFRKAIPKTLYDDIKKDIICRAATRLGINQKHRQSKTVAHRYYCEIMMPDGQGAALDAYNQVSYCIAPFLEPRIIGKGYETILYHHSGGEFEGKLIEFIDPALAAIPSSYGYSIGKRPLKAKIKESIRTYIPTFIWNKLSVSIGKKHTLNEESIMKELYANSQTLKNAYTFICKLFPEIDFAFLLEDKESIRRIQFVAMTIYQLRERIIVN